MELIKGSQKICITDCVYGSIIQDLKQLTLWRGYMQQFLTCQEHICTLIRRKTILYYWYYEVTLLILCVRQNQSTRKYHIGELIFFCTCVWLEGYTYVYNQIYCGINYTLKRYIISGSKWTIITYAWKIRW